MKIAIDNLQISINVALDHPGRETLTPLGRKGNYKEGMLEIAGLLEPAAKEELLARQSKWVV